MACYADNAPIIVERGRGPRADRRRRPPLPRRHLLAVGHDPRPPGARARRGGPRAARAGRPHHAARQRQPGHHRARRGARARVPGERAPLPVRLRRRRGGGAGAEDRVPVLDQPGRRPGAPATWPSATPTTATPSARSRSAPAGFGTDVFDPLRFPVLRAPGYADPGWADTAVALIAAHADELAAVVLEPLVQGAAGMQVTDPAVGRAGRRRLPRARRAARRRRGRHRVRSHRHPLRLRAVPHPARPDVHRQGPHRRLPADGRHRRQPTGVRGLPRARPERARPSTTGTPTRGTPWPRPWPAATSSSSTSSTCWPTSGSGPPSSVPSSTPTSPRRPGVREVRRRGLMAGVELDPPGPDLRWGRRACAAAVRRGVLLRPLGDVVVLMPMLTSTPEEIERIVVGARRGRRRGVRVVSDRCPLAGAWADGERRRASAHAGRWREPRPFDAAGPTGPSPPPARRVVSFASNDYLGPVPAPRRCRPRPPPPLERWGTGAAAGPPHRGLPPRPPRARGRARRLAGHRGGRGVPHRLRRQPRACSSMLGRAGRAHLLRRAEPRLDRRRVPPGPGQRGRAAGLPATATSTPSRPCWPSPDRPAGSSSTDSVFSMDGDVAPVAGPRRPLRPPRRRCSCSTRPTRCSSRCRHHDPSGPVVLQVGTLSKTLGALGGFVAGPRAFTELVVNRARSYIFTTALEPGRRGRRARRGRRRVAPPRGAPCGERLRGHVERLRAGPPQPGRRRVLGDEERAPGRRRRALLEQGLLVPAIRPPTVAPGTSRLRIALSAAHTDAQVDGLAAAPSSRLGQPAGEPGT